MLINFVLTNLNVQHTKDNIKNMVGTNVLYLYILIHVFLKKQNYSHSVGSDSKIFIQLLCNLLNKVATPGINF